MSVNFAQGCNKIVTMWSQPWEQIEVPCNAMV